MSDVEPWSLVARTGINRIFLFQCNQVFSLKIAKQQCYKIFLGFGDFYLFIGPNLSPINDKISMYRLSPINDKSSSLGPMPALPGLRTLNGSI